MTTPAVPVEPVARVGHEAGTFGPEPEPPDRTPTNPDEFAGREAIVGSPELARMREVVTLLDTHAATFRERIEALTNDEDLSPAGRDRKIQAVERERDQRLADIAKTYDQAEASLLKRYANAEPTPLPVQAGDAARMQLALAKMQALSPEAGIKLMRRYVDAGDRVAVQELLDVFADVAERRPDYVDLLAHTPVSSNPITDLLTQARLLLVGESNFAARYAREVLPQARAELDVVLAEIKDHGRWSGSPLERTEGTAGERALKILAVPTSEA